MLCRMSVERPKDWDRYHPVLLFAIREFPQESLGFSPFELLYGHNVHGPMAPHHPKMIKYKLSEMPLELQLRNRSNHSKVKLDSIGSLSQTSQLQLHL